MVQQEAFPFRKISIKAPNGRFLTAFSNGLIKVEGDQIQELSTFTVHPCEESSQFALQSHHGTFLCAEDGVNCNIIASRDKFDERERFRFTLQEESNLKICKGYFQSYDGLYMTIDDAHSHLTYCTGKIEEATMFEVICLESVDMNTANDGLPTAIVLGSAAAIGVVGAVPHVAVATIQGIGFGSSGIIAGSTAAAMMSAEAIAIGGGVTSGLTVATLQSIGAVGMAGALPIVGIVLLSLSGAAAVGFGIFRCVETFTKCPRESSKTKQESFPFRKIAIRAPNGRFLKALGGGKGNWFFDWRQGPCYTGVIKAEADQIKGWETFTVHPCETSSQFALQSHHGAFLCADNNHGVKDIMANRHKIDEWEKFRFILIEKQKECCPEIWKGYFQTYKGSYITINHKHCHFTANAANREEAAIFEVIKIN